jgi:hypothetical protein
MHAAQAPAARIDMPKGRNKDVSLNVHATEGNIMEIIISLEYC